MARRTAAWVGRRQGIGGIVQEIFRRIGVVSRTCIEIGVGSGLENNTLYWLKQSWRGAWIEGSAENASFIRQAFAAQLAGGALHFQEAFASVQSVNRLVRSAGLMGQEIDLVSIDIDGNDYYVFERLDVVSPRLVVIEYNPRFKPPVCWRIP